MLHRVKPATGHAQMSHVLMACVLVAALTASAGGDARAQSEPGSDQASEPARAPQAATHAVRGVVTSSGVTWLAISRVGKPTIDLRFVLTPATLREGGIEVGATVSVRYRVEGATLVATAVVVRVHPGGRPQAAVARVPWPTPDAALAPRASEGAEPCD